MVLVEKLAGVEMEVSEKRLDVRLLEVEVMEEGKLELEWQEVEVEMVEEKSHRCLLQRCKREERRCHEQRRMRVVTEKVQWMGL